MSSEKDQEEQMILPIEQQVCSFESAKKLKKLGAPQDNLWYWLCDKEYGRYFSSPIQKVSDGVFCSLHWDGVNGLYHKRHYISWDRAICSAYTCAELGELLDVNVTTGRRSNTEWYCIYYDAQYKMHSLDNFEKTEVEVKAKMFIYLLENKIINLGG